MTTPSTQWTEKPTPGEAQRHAAQAERLGALQKARAAASNGKDRALHAKQHVGLHAVFHVLPDLAPHVGAGWLGVPHAYEAFVRFSNGGGTREPDRKPDVRGIAVKVVGVPGKKLIPGLENAVTQDFLCILSDSMPFTSSAGFIDLVEAAAGPQWALLPKLLMKWGPVQAFSTLKKMAAGLGAPLTSALSNRYFTNLPLSWGPHAAKVCLVPRGLEPTPLEGKSASLVRDDLLQRLRAGPASFDVMVQFFVDEARTPIENPSVAWTAEVAPWIPFARLDIPQQDPESPAGLALHERVESFSFDPWHATEDFRPLGEMMRARKEAYRVSGMARQSAPEPTLEKKG